ncbi:unnamed protein product [Cuscuta epithymum]|uniref:Serine incorporator n=1 Tax=Cuscuta epithymum TaxID=186058 RepID=A0AAV0G9A6_9ASTE|nr:unnamed protein product [Cuscuta epithymum]
MTRILTYAYGSIFLVTSLLSWAARDFGYTTLKAMKWLRGCNGEEVCLGAQGALRVSLGCFIFYFIMFVSTAGASTRTGHREEFHSGCWFLKIPMMVVLIVVSFLLPINMIYIYGLIAHFGAGIFLIFQLVSIITFIQMVNDWCYSDTSSDKRCIIGGILAVGSNLLACGSIIFLFIWYAERTSCKPNYIFTGVTLALFGLMSGATHRSKAKATYLNSGFMGVYITFLCWSAIKSEPHGGRCMERGGTDTPPKVHLLTVVSFAIGFGAMIFATFSTGVDSKSFQFKIKEHRDDNVPYGYGFFHLVFATASMYSAMLLVNWNTKNPTKFMIDVGWASTWIKFIYELFAAFIYIFILTRKNDEVTKMTG